MDHASADPTFSASVAAQIAARVNPDRAFSYPRTYSNPTHAWYMLGSFIALISIIHFATSTVVWIKSRRRAISRSFSRGSLSWARVPLVVLNLARRIMFRTTISFGGKYNRNLTELFLGSAYIAFLFAWTFNNTTNLAGVSISPQYYANRAGLMAASQLPFMIALGMKNNILTLLTGVSLDKLNVLHRIAARVICVLLWTHAAGHIIENGVEGNIEDLRETWFRCGIMAISAFTLLSLFSFQPLRGRAYEFFLVCHLFVALIILGGAYYHANNNGLGYYIWPSLVVWGFDRSLRFIRIFFVNGGVLTLFNTKSSPSLRAKIEVISPQFLRVTVRRPDYFRWSPGQLAYLSIPRVSAMPWEAHPFTIASIDGDIPRAAAPESPGEDSSSEKVDLAESEVASAASLSHPGYSKKLVFLLRVHDGFTRRMLHAACSPSPLDDAFNAYIDGPYCAPPTVRGFETVLLFSGGSGVSFILPLFLDVIKGANTATNSICRRVVMIWAVRHQEHITAISDDLLDALAGVTASLQIDIRIHVTAATRNSESDAEKSEGSISSSETKKRKILDAPCVRLLSGRPDVAAVIKSEVAEASGSISVNVCGTAGLAENVRTALRTVSTASDILKGGPSISLHVEAFGM